MDIGTRIENPVQINWKPQGDTMLLNLKVGTWSDSDIRLNKREAAIALTAISNFLKGGGEQSN